MALSSMVIILGTVLSASVSTAVLLSTTQTGEEQANAVVDDTLTDLCDGLMVVDATGHYAGNRLTSLVYIMRPLPGSDPVNLENVVMIVTTETDETIYTLNNSTNVFLTHVFNGDNDTVVSRGDLLRLTIPNLDVAVGEDVIIKLVPSEGQALTMSFTVPDSMGNGLVVFT